MPLTTANGGQGGKRALVLGFEVWSPGVISPKAMSAARQLEARIARCAARRCVIAVEWPSPPRALQNGWVTHGGGVLSDFTQTLALRRTSAAAALARSLARCPGADHACPPCSCRHGPDQQRRRKTSETSGLSSMQEGFSLLCTPSKEEFFPCHGCQEDRKGGASNIGRSEAVAHDAGPRRLPCEPSFVCQGRRPAGP